MKQAAFLRCFLNAGQSFGGLKHLTEKMTAMASLTHIWVIVDHTLVTKLKDLSA